MTTPSPIDKSATELNALSMKQKWFLQQLYKRQANGSALTDEEREIASRFGTQWAAALKIEKAKRPVIVFLLIGSLLAVLRGCS